MADAADLVSKVSPEGRVVIPAEVRRRLGVSPGDLVHFLLQADGAVELVTARMLIEHVWANNHGGDALDSTDLVRAERVHDRVVDAQSEARIEADSGSAWDERAETDLLLAELGLGQ